MHVSSQQIGSYEMIQSQFLQFLFRYKLVIVVNIFGV
jgi:hypothetical protein